MKRLFRRPLSVVLALVLLLTSVLAALPLSAWARTVNYAENVTVGPFLEVAPDSPAIGAPSGGTSTSAAPFDGSVVDGTTTGRTYTALFDKASETPVAPLEWAPEAKGTKLSLWGTHTAFTYGDGVELDVWRDYYHTIKVANGVADTDTHLIMYIETDGKAVLYPGIKYTDTYVAYYIKDNGTYDVLADGATSWSTKDAAAVGAAWGSYSGGFGIKFDSAFKGFVRIAYADLLTNEGAGSYPTGGSLVKTAGWQLQTIVCGMGGEYASNITIGPLFSGTGNIKAPVVNDGPLKGDVIETTGANGGSMTNAAVSTVKPVEDIESNGYKMTVNTAFDLNKEEDPAKVVGWGAVGSMLHVFMEPYSLKSTATDIMVYVSTDGPTTVTPSMLAEYTYHLGNKEGIKLLADGETTWSDATVAEFGKNTGYFGVEFTEAFSGFIKIPLANMVRHDDGKSMADIMATKTLTISDIYIQLESMGSVEVEDEIPVDMLNFATEIITGPFFEEKASAANGTVIPTETYNGGSMTNCGLEKLTPINGIDAFGYKMTVNKSFTLSNEYDPTKVAGWGAAGSMLHIILGDSSHYTLNSSTAYISMYVKVDGPTTIAPSFLVDSYAYYVTADSQPEMKAMDATSWSKATLDELGYKTEYFGVKFTEAFEGYVRFPVNAIAKPEDGTTFSQKMAKGKVTISDIYVQVESMGTVEKPEPLKFKDVTEYGIPIPTTNHNGVSMTAAKVEKVQPLDYVFTGGYKMTVKNPFDNSSEKDPKKVMGWGATPSLLHIIMKAWTVDPNATDIVMYVKTNGPTTYSPFFLVGDYYFMLSEKTAAKVQKMGETAWTDAKLSPMGSGTVYNGIEFTSAFEGFVKISVNDIVRLEYDKQKLSKRADEGAKITDIYVQVEAMGGKYASEITVAPFFEYTDPNYVEPGPYVAKNVWDKKDLPEMVPFTPVVDQFWYYEMANEVIPSPIPTLSSNIGMYHMPANLVDVEGQGTHTTDYHSTQTYDYMPVGEFTHLMFYIEVPEAKGNSMSINLYTGEPYVGNSKDYQMMANALYSLLPLGETEWQHSYAEDVQKYGAGSIIFPAGFKGFVKIPLESLRPNTVSADTVIRYIYYRFGYAGMDNDKVLIGPVFGVTKDNDPGPAEIVLDALPAATTIRRVFQPENGDIYPDRVLLYWQSVENAKYYEIDTYTVKKADKGYQYKFISTSLHHTNSGSVLGLEPGESYAFVVKAYDSTNMLIATYEYVRLKTPTQSPYIDRDIFQEIVPDTVLYPGASAGSQGGAGVNWLLIGIIGGAVVLLGGAAAVTIVIVNKKRRKTNA